MTGKNGSFSVTIIMVVLLSVFVWLPAVLEAPQVSPNCLGRVDGSEFGGKPIDAYAGVVNSVAIGDINGNPPGSTELEYVTVGYMVYQKGSGTVTAPYIQVWRYGCPSMQKLDTIAFGGKQQGAFKSVAIGNFYGGDARLEVVAVGAATGNGAGLIEALRWDGPGKYTTRSEVYNPVNGLDLRAVAAGDQNLDGINEFWVTGNVTYLTVPTSRTFVGQFVLNRELTRGAGGFTAVTDPDGDGASNKNEGWGITWWPGARANPQRIFVSGQVTSATGPIRAFVLRFDLGSNGIPSFDGARDVWSYGPDPGIKTVAGSVDAFFYNAYRVIAVGVRAWTIDPQLPDFAAIRLRDYTLGTSLSEYDFSNSFRAIQGIQPRDSNGDGVKDQLVTVGLHRPAGNVDSYAAYALFAWSPWVNPTLQITNYWGTGFGDGAFGVSVRNIAGGAAEDIIVAADVDSRRGGEFMTFVGEIDVFQS